MIKAKSLLMPSKLPKNQIKARKALLMSQKWTFLTTVLSMKMKPIMKEMLVNDLTEAQSTAVSFSLSLPFPSTSSYSYLSWVTQSH